MPPSRPGEQVNVRVAGFTGDVQLCHRGTYSYVAHLPSGLANSIGAPFAEDQRIRVIQTRRSQEETDDMLRALVTQYSANPGASRHRHITPSIPVPLYHNISGQMHPTTAFLSPWFEHDGILAYIQSGSSHSKIKMAVQLAKAVEHLHAHNIVHGNIYPGNVFVTSQGRVALSDASVFTLARRLHPELTGRLVESSMYQAPEYHWPGTDNFVPPITSTDIYALSTTIFAIYTENPPFQRVTSIRTIEQAVGKILTTGHLGIPRPSSGFCDELWELLQRCWSLNPAHRPSIVDVVAELEYIELYC